MLGQAVTKQSIASCHGEVLEQIGIGGEHRTASRLPECATAAGEVLNRIDFGRDSVRLDAPSRGMLHGQFDVLLSRRLEGTVTTSMHPNV